MASATIIMGYQVCSSQWTVCNLTNNSQGTAYFGLFWTQICTTGCYKTTDSGSIVELCTDDRTYCTNYQNFVVLIPMAIAAFLGFMMSTILLTKLCGIAATKDVRICGGVSVTCLVLSLIIYPAMSLSQQCRLAHAATSSKPAAKSGPIDIFADPQKLRT
eukprot:935042_1